MIHVATPNFALMDEVKEMNIAARYDRLAFISEAMYYIVRDKPVRVVHGMPGPGFGLIEDIT